MKSLNYKLLLALLLVFTISSCSKDDDSDSNTETNMILLVNTVQSGNWRVTKFIDSGDDETSHFIGYNFTFNSDKTLIATNGTNTYNGTWSIVESNSSDDSIDDLDIIISFTSSIDFEELTEDWDIISRTNTKLELNHVIGGNGGTDYLTFEKN